MQQLWAIADFVRAVRRKMRFGELSRKPLQIARLEWRADGVECDWILRSADAWDSSLGARQQECNVSQQALLDAMALRELIFTELPGVASAALRGFRSSVAGEPPELVIVGTVLREEANWAGVRSLAMQVKLCGLQFNLDNGVLRALQEGVHASRGVSRLEEVNFDGMTL